MNVSVIIPALNEAEAIGAVVADALAQTVLEVVVADNGSGDGTAEAATAAGATVVVEPRRGYGFACAAGSRAARGDILVYMDGDGSFLAAEMPRLLAPIQAGRADLVLGSRREGSAPGAMPPHQRFGNWLAAGLLWALYGVQVTDLGPFRAITRTALAGLEMTEMTYGWPTEMMVKAVRTGLRLEETPVTYLPRRAGRSKVGGTVRGSVLAGVHILGVTLKYAI